MPTLMQMVQQTAMMAARTIAKNYPKESAAAVRQTMIQTMTRSMTATTSALMMPPKQPQAYVVAEAQILTVTATQHLTALIAVTLIPIKHSLVSVAVGMLTPTPMQTGRQIATMDAPTIQIS
jgi:hypothetical protein